jgi:hypothetical protein
MPASVFHASAQTKWDRKICAPRAIAHDGKYYLCLDNGGGNIGVVVGTNPVMTAASPLC